MCVCVCVCVCVLLQANVAVAVQLQSLGTRMSGIRYSQHDASKKIRNERTGPGERRALAECQWKLRPYIKMAKGDIQSTSQSSRPSHPQALIISIIKNNNKSCREDDGIPTKRREIANANSCAEVRRTGYA